MKVGFIGAGMMGEALLAGVLRGELAPSDVVVCEKRSQRAAELHATYGVTLTSKVSTVTKASTIFIVVKPGDVNDVVGQMAQTLREDHLLVSFAAGISTAAIEAAVGRPVPVVRVMPNAPALVGMGMAVQSRGRFATGEHALIVERLLAPTGKVATVGEEQQDAVTAVSGSGPAYLFLVIEALVDAGVGLGLSREIASELATQTMLGAATMASVTEEEPALLRERVTSPGGTTAAALEVFEDADLRAVFSRALAAARDRSRELSRDSQP